MDFRARRTAAFWPASVVRVSAASSRSLISLLASPMPTLTVILVSLGTAITFGILNSSWSFGRMSLLYCSRILGGRDLSFTVTFSVSVSFSFLAAMAFTSVQLRVALLAHARLAPVFELLESESSGLLALLAHDHELGEGTDASRSRMPPLMFFWGLALVWRFTKFTLSDQCPRLVRVHGDARARAFPCPFQKASRPGRSS